VDAGQDFLAWDKGAGPQRSAALSDASETGEYVEWDIAESDEEIAWKCGEFSAKLFDVLLGFRRDMRVLLREVNEVFYFVAKRLLLDHVGDVEVTATEASSLEALVEELAGRAYEGTAKSDFLCAEGFADENSTGIERAFGADGLDGWRE
jgi:hypothetical protein